ncbi:U2 snRNP complex subunit HSH155 KNAG_0D02750 [Huiozyma naganishii CBS 8797]|uniref:Phosphatase PP2A regulatory subunit A/Splicing factor 3B subunit 1-like HEAT repeat domain-containing protein n=1 Tax=Huiozyma naganishii (strain ATCC MYA-139 / BCRC 22969 / CBS 8797 / KCTC 17520 / NBRC 10181 / NCYC 3082 / Yp74L-3) TaxID=1071383 RepID=J7S5V3_HUIN7|nr:hypothetical protein KNAG_0D02750 [Kazachstania naganishii CBS 8797]CCK70024.1 hypothetical protein KNAG_0D02750 [Kazachstania naganishii CBS 8797]
MSDGIAPMAENDTQHKLAGQYSISTDLKAKIASDLIENDDEFAKDELQKRMESRSVYSKADEYHRKRLVGRQDSTNDDLQKKKSKSRWDVQSYTLPDESQTLESDVVEVLTASIPCAENLRYFKESDRLLFAQTLDKKSIDDLSPEEKSKRTLLLLLLKIKNGSTSARKIAMKQLTNKVFDFSPQLIFDCILPILLDKTLEDHERYLMIKVMDRVLYRLGPTVKPFVKSILVVISPLLIDEDEVARTTGQEVITNLASATGMATMLLAIRPDIDNEDEYIRNMAARTFAVVSKALGVKQLLPFINAVCHSNKSWRARHTGVRMVQQIAILLGPGILRNLPALIQCIKDGLTDEHTPVKMMTANTLTTLAQNSYLYGIEAFNIILEPLWKGIRRHRGKLLSSFLKCLAGIIPLMDPEYAGYYTHELMTIIQRNFNSPDDEMKKTVLIVLQKCVRIENVTPEFLRESVAPSFFQNFWIRRIALDRHLNKMVVYTTVILSEKLGCSYVIDRLLGPLKDEAEPFRVMALHGVNRAVKLLGTDDLDDRQEARLVDALLIAFQDQDSDDPVIFRGFGTVASSLNTRMKPFLSPIISTILNQLKHKSQTIRQNAADLCTVMIPILKNCKEMEILNKLNIILYESLGEVYPEVLGSIIKCMSSIIAVVKLDKLQPPVNQILPTLTPILRNKHPKVQINVIRLIGNVAERGSTYVAPKEWMRICFALLEMLKSPKKRILRTANDTFGYIAKAIGPQDILVVLLNNLKIQERQSRVSTAVAIGIVAETCGPYTVIPALMNEYKTPDTNVKNGILKAMTFMFEYIGPLSQDHIYLITPLLEDALTDRDLVHRQTAATVVKHLALHCAGTGTEDAFIHLLNLLMPNIYETSPHVIVRILESLEAVSYAVGTGPFMNYVWAGLFHPAKKVRKAFWKLYNNIYIQQVDAMVPYYPIDTNEDSMFLPFNHVL